MLGWIETTRHKCVESMLSFIYEAIRIQMESVYEKETCKGNCKMASIGILVRTLHAAGISNDYPRWPYRGYSWESLKAFMEQIEKPSCPSSDEENLGCDVIFQRLNLMVAWIERKYAHPVTGDRLSAHWKTFPGAKWPGFTPTLASTEGSLQSAI